MKRIKRSFTFFCLLIGLLGLMGCSSPSSLSETNIVVTEEKQDVETKVKETAQGQIEEPSDCIDWKDLLHEGTMELLYADKYSVDYYEGGYRLLTITDGTRLLTIPEGREVPENLDSDIIPLKQPMKDIYLVASAAMDMFVELDALESISLSGQKEENWYVPEAKEAMARGDMVYAVKYNKPDY